MKKRLLRQSNNPKLRFERRAAESGYKKIAGIDEAGRGPLAGPVVAACVMLKDFAFNSRIDDSKLLTGKARKKAFSEILKKSLYGIGIVDERVIDKINIYNATCLAMKKAVLNMADDPDIIFVDGTLKLDISNKTKNIIQGDKKSFSIGCASIVAKVVRDAIMEEYDEFYPEYGFRRHKGYGTKMHMEALVSLGPVRIHRYSFKPVYYACCDNIRL